MALQSDSVVVRVRSHRAWEKLCDMIGRIPGSYYSWDDGAVFHELTPEEWARFKDARWQRRVYWHSSATRSRVDRAALRECW